MTAATHAASAGLLFMKQFVRHPRMVGSVIPTSGIAVRALLDPVDWRAVRCVVEYGPGTGVFTRDILRRLSPDARLIAIDTNRRFIEHLHGRIRDERLIAVEGSAVDVEAIVHDQGFDAADHIVSGLPFSTLPPGIADQIMDATARILAPGGAFMIYQYSLFVLPFLEPRFDLVDRNFVLRCFPPARLFWAWKAGDQLIAADGENLVVA